MCVVGQLSSPKNVIFVFGNWKHGFFGEYFLMDPLVSSIGNSRMTSFLTSNCTFCTYSKDCSKYCFDPSQNYNIFPSKLNCPQFHQITNSCLYFGVDPVFYLLDSIPF